MKDRIALVNRCVIFIFLFSKYLQSSYYVLGTQYIVMNKLDKSKLCLGKLHQVGRDLGSLSMKGRQLSQLK